MALSHEEDPLLEERRSPTTLDGVRVLLVDDEEDVIELYAHTLREAGATVHATFDGAAALDALAAGDFDVVISDLDMPHLDGIEMIRRVRTSEAFGPVPAMAITGSTRDAARRHALEAGFDAFSPKPLAASKLVDAVRGLVRTGEARRNGSSATG